jgi:hypothetical protein
MNKFERDIQQEMDVNEGMLSKLAAAFATRGMRRKYGKSYKTAFDIARKDPELRAALAGLENYHARLNRIIKNLCKRNPDHPTCDDKKR